MAGGEICANHQVRGLPAMGLHALHEIGNIFAGTEIAVVHDGLEDAEILGASCDVSGKSRQGRGTGTRFI